MTENSQNWQSGSQLAITKLVAAGLEWPDARKALAAAGMLVDTAFHIPTDDELMTAYHRLGQAHLSGTIKLRWVMCAETHDAIAQRYRDRVYANHDETPSWRSDVVMPSDDVVQHEVRKIMKARRRWTDTSTLFGIPIRIDPAARTPMFEVES